MSELAVSRGNIFYTTRGKGETVVFLNGIMMTTDVWQFQTEAFSQKYQVLLHDFLGQGRSDKPAHGYSLGGHCQDLLALLDHLQVEKAHVVGVSYGGEVGLLFAASYPERVQSLTVGTAVSEIHPLLAAMGKSWIAAAELADGKRFFEIITPLVYSNSFLAEKQEWLDRRKEIFARVATPDWFAAFLGLMKSFMQLNLTPELRKIKAPTLVLAAEEDILKPPYYSEIIARGIEGAILKTVPGTGHALPMEKPGEFNELVQEFLDSLD